MAVKTYPTNMGILLMTDPAILPTCRLKKMKSDDGRWEFKDDMTYVGKTYKYAANSRRVVTIFNQRLKQEFPCEVVLVYDPRGLFCMMPTECLDFTEQS